jgi:hypothetical protein
LILDQSFSLDYQYLKVDLTLLNTHLKLRVHSYTSPESVISTAEFSFNSIPIINGAAKSPAKEYNNAGDLNKKDVLKALYPTPLKYQEGKNSALATFTSNLAAILIQLV